MIVLSTRYGRTLPLAAAIAVTMLATWALHFSGVPAVDVVADCVVGVTWAFCIPYLLGMCSEFDSAGQMAALGGFASKMGLASGPLVVALVVGADNYKFVINVGVVVHGLSLVAAMLPSRLLEKKPADRTPPPALIT